MSSSRFYAGDSPTQRVLDALGPSVQPTSTGWKACCPAHDDRTPSLTVTTGDDGKVLLNCHRDCSTESVCQALGMSLADLMPPNGLRRKAQAQRKSEPKGLAYQSDDEAIKALERQLGMVDGFWEYHDVEGNIIGYVLRWNRPDGMKMIRPIALHADGWRIGGMPEPRPLYRLPDLADAKTVYITEGEKAADAARSIGLIATTSAHGSKSAGQSDWSPLAGKNVVILPDNDEPGQKYAETVCGLLSALDPAPTIKVVELPSLPEHGDVWDWLEERDAHEPDELRNAIEDLSESVTVWKPADNPRKTAASQNNSRRSQATLLVKYALAGPTEFFHSPGDDAEGYIRIQKQGHWENFRINSKRCRHWLSQLFWEMQETAPNAQAIVNAMAVLNGHAHYHSPMSPVYCRVAGDEQTIWLDLCNENWQAVKITAESWEIIDDPAVRFTRRRGMLGLPIPERGGDLSEFRAMLNVRSDEDWLLILSWVVAAYRPFGPYPILGLNGEQGSAKSTTSRMLRSLVDPNKAPLRSEPKEPRDLMIAANNAWQLAFDNLSFISPTMSDALCRLSTGGGFATRELYSNDEEILFDSQRPVLINGITELSTRPDLLDRTISVTLPTVPEEKRRTESAIWKEFLRIRPRIIGALLDAVAIALGRHVSVRLKRLPRMADFATWAVAAEPALGVSGVSFLDAYDANRESANESAIQSSLIADPIMDLMADLLEWSGTATSLLEELKKRVDETTTKQKAWPKLPHLLSGQLRRIAPNLRRMGFDIHMDRQGADRRRIIRIAHQKKTPANERSERSERSEPQKTGLW